MAGTATEIRIDGTPTNGSNPWIDGLVWGGRWVDTLGLPTTGGPVTLTFALMSGSDPYGYLTGTGIPWSLPELEALLRAMTAWEALANIDFVYTTDPNAADVWIWKERDNGSLGQSEIPSYSTGEPLYLRFNGEDPSWTSSGLAVGGYAYLTLLHELGHLLGLAHPHDGGSASDGNVFPGVSSAFGDFGDYNLNQGIFTIMSYNDGWASQFPSHFNNNYGWQASPMALDVAAIQLIYGKNTTYASGSNVYYIPTSNINGTYWSCLWDTGGIDTISNVSSTVSCLINLNDAPLEGPNAGGYVSYALNIVGGFTIANGVVIENAVGGQSNDTLIGNSTNNNLDGGNGNDRLTGGKGNDTLNGGSGTDYAYFNDNQSECTITFSSGNIIVGSKTEGTDTLTNIEYVVFNGVAVAVSSLISDTTGPAFTSATTSADGLKVILTYNEPLSATTAAKTAFAVKVAGVTATVSSVAVNGSTIELTLATSIGAGQTVTVGYKAPTKSGATTNAAVQDIGGNDAATLSSTTAVTNISTADKTGPAFTSATTSVDGLKIILTYNEPLSATTAAKTAFAVKVAGVTATVSSVAVNGSTIELTLATSIGAGQTVTVGYKAPTASAATTNAAVQDAGGNDAATLAATTAVTNISTADKTAPVVSTFSPTDGLTDVLVGSNIVLTFSETITRGTGTITLRSGSATGAIVESFDAATSNRITMSGSTLTIDPTSDLAYGTKYFVVFTSGNIKDTAGNDYTGISTYDFISDDFSNTTASTGQVLVGGAASKGNMGIYEDTDVFKVTLTAGVTYTFDLKATSGSINPYLSLFDPSVTQVAFNNDHGSSVNSQFTYTAAVSGTYYLLTQVYSGSGTYSLSASVDKTAPTVFTFAPTDGLTGVAAGSNIVLTFSETIARGTGTITLRSGSATGAIVESFDAATSNRLTVSGSTLTIDPTSVLSANTQYFVVFTSGNIKDIAGNAYAGISTYDFRTVNIVNGTANNDTLTGTANADTINGLSGNDIITGGASTDSMDGGEGYDLYLVAASADHSAAEFADTGASGTDEVRFTSTTANATLTLYAGDTGIERVAIGTGTAAAAVTTARTALNIDASRVLNGLSIAGNAGANVITGSAYADYIWGYAGNDTINGGDGSDIISGGTGTNKLNGGAGFDAVDYRDSITAVTVSLAITTAQTTGGGGADTLSGFEAILGGSANDVLTGDDNDNTIYGYNGNDTINGGEGNDVISGGVGTNTLIGGTGFDFVDYRDSITAVTVSLAFTTAQTTGGGGTDTLNDFEGILGGSGNDVLTGDDDDDVIYGYNGNDTINGDDGNDALYGGAGYDDLYGGNGNDSLTGGSGDDWFFFVTTPSATNTDTITDFTSGTDKLQFSKTVFTGLSAAALGDLSSNAFWSGAGVTTAHDADDRFIYNTTTGALYYDADGNASGSAAVLVAMLGATTPLAFTDLQIIG